MNSFLDKFFRWERFRKIIKHIPRNSIVCDIGCGKEGVLLNKISKFIKYGVGFDKNIENKKKEKYELVKLEILEEIPEEKETYNIVTVVAVLEHLLNPEEILKESHRILKKNGKLILTTPTPLAKPILEFLALKLKLIDRNEMEDHKNYFWPKDVKKILLKVGFKEQNIKINYFEFFLNGLIVAQK
ncbi:MAG: class I SAM-dependent methyltransferase [Candidatus Nealsonbacteria bacterium]